ncbi:hypothetical protein D9619_008969 [Psilocybe cf. subviscida]|uniref:Uncharacterized protein n=1 Tax=Psilocybe cf. subviscida TaxID=2480587 RepID=A0A8H5FAG5_9AGAR|nr:hypothetical protein D9619_008969 [Psilocybe cf. subviscida]
MCAGHDNPTGDEPSGRTASGDYNDLRTYPRPPQACTATSTATRKLDNANTTTRTQRHRRNDVNANAAASESANAIGWTGELSNPNAASCTTTRTRRSASLTTCNPLTQDKHMQARPSTGVMLKRHWCTPGALIRRHQQTVNFPIVMYTTNFKLNPSHKTHDDSQQLNTTKRWHAHPHPLESREQLC